MRFNRTAIVQASIAAIAVLLFVFYGKAPGIIKYGSAAELGTQKMEPLHVKLVLQRVYLDGEISEEIVQEKIYSFENFWAKYEQWQIKQVNRSEMIFTKQVDDISPLLKANGYFGITDNGVLTIFNGKPKQSHIIQSFFQIDIKKLESSKQQELMDGIPIKSKDHYVQVLETFKPYSAEGS